MSYLREVFDDLSHSSDKWEPYFEVYERHLRQFCMTECTLVEVGVQKGGSLEMWSKYLGTHSKIFGIDIDTECANLKYVENNIKVEIADQKSMTFWDAFLEKNPKIDIFIDDAGHFCDAQISTFEKVFPTLPIGSIYICEDVHTSYMLYNGGGYKIKNSFIEYAKNYVDVIHSNWVEGLDTSFEHVKKIGKDLTSVHIYDSMVVFEKFGKRNMNRVFPKQFPSSE